ncbi:MAG: DUF885 domain-containing protein [Acidobacteriota bacterium]|nr:DUF885 domain-containing protein [Acidobacteriota bacterium]
MRTRTLLLCLGLLAAPFTANAQRIQADGATQTFSYLADAYFNDVYFRYNPTTGTASGLHQYDTQLEDYSAAGMARESADLHSWEAKIAAVDPGLLDAAEADDRSLLLNSIRSQLLTLEQIRPAEKDPDSYSTGVTSSIFVLIERPYASADARLHAVIARERLMPQVFAEARRNLRNPAQISTEIALEQINDDISFFQKDVPAALVTGPGAATSAAEKAEFARTNAAVMEAMQQYAAWMKTDLLPRSHGDFRLGPDTFRKKLLYDEMVDLPLDRLLVIAFADIHRNQAEFQRVAHDLDPDKTPQQVLAELSNLHTTPEKLLPAFQTSFNNLIEFIRTHHIVTIPSTVQPTLEETPPFMRATTMASMDPPGPFETHSTRAYFNVTLPEKDWTPEHLKDFMQYYNVGVVNSTSIHEAYPGHYIQYLFQPQFPSKIRLILQASTNVEGWAHYCEQMMLDEGYGAAGTVGPDGKVIDQRTALFLRMGQLQDALLRDARFVVAIKLHTGTGEASGSWSLEQAREFFVQQGYQPRSTSEVEVNRATSDPTYLYYTLGKLQIMKLREDVRARQGAAFNLQRFHDDFLRQGAVPMQIIRREMLHDDSPTL